MQYPKVSNSFPVYPLRTANFSISPPFPASHNSLCLQEDEEDDQQGQGAGGRQEEQEQEEGGRDLEAQAAAAGWPGDHTAGQNGHQAWAPFSYRVT